MEKFQAFINWLIANKLALVAFVTSLYFLVEVVVRLTPTKSDDTVLEKIGKGLGWVFDFLKLPNNLKKE